MRNYFSHTDFFETMDIVQSITAVDIEEAMQSLDLSNYSIVRLHPTQEVQ